MLALQDVPPVVCPRQEAPLGGADRQVLVVAGSEKNMFPRWIGLHTKDVRLVVNEDVSTHDCLVSGQNDLLQEVGAQVSLYPCILFIWTVGVVFNWTGANEDISSSWPSPSQPPHFLVEVRAP